MRPLVYILVLTAALVAVRVLFHTVLAQAPGAVPFDRNGCQQNCAWQSSPGDNGFNGIYYTCMAKCDNEFWKNVERDIGETTTTR